jgi:hypothetical protein
MEVFLQTNLLDTIGTIWKDNLIIKSQEEQLTSSGTVYVNSTCEYFGHFALLANMILDIADDEKPALKGFLV